MRYLIVIRHVPYSHTGSFLGLQFAKAVINAGHCVDQVFFMQDGVYNANALLSPANDEHHLLKGWQAFAQAHHVPLNLCIAAAQRRGVVDEQTTPLATKTNLAEPFQLAGLGEFSQAVFNADRLIQF